MDSVYLLLSFMIVRINYSQYMERGKVMYFYGTTRVNKKGNLEIGGVDTVELAEEFGTPFMFMTLH